MSVMSSETIAFDFRTLVPELLEAPSRASARGRFIMQDGSLHFVRNQTRQDYYDCNMQWPSTPGGFATGTLFFYCKELDLFNLVLLQGIPVGPNDYLWCGICPKTLKPSQMLYLDRASQLLVCRKAVGKQPPEALKRLTDIQVVVEKVRQKHPGFSYDPRVDCNIDQLIAKDPEFELLDSLFDLLHLDLFFAKSGYPCPVKKDPATIDVLATIQNAKERERLPAALRKRIKPSRPPKTYNTPKEILERFKERQLPIPHSLEDYFRRKKKAS